MLKSSFIFLILFCSRVQIAISSTKGKNEKSTESNTCISSSPGVCENGDGNANETTVDDQLYHLYKTSKKSPSLFIKCKNEQTKCDQWGASECEKNPYFMKQSCRKTCGNCNEYDIDTGERQQIEGATAMTRRTFKLHMDSIEYKKKLLLNPEISDGIKSICINKHQLCSYWASIGECSKNPNYMKFDCGLACQSCEDFDIEKRCPLDPDAIDAISNKEGKELHRIFEQIADVNGSFAHYKPHVLSHPNNESVFHDPDILNKIQYGIENPVKDGPWVIVLDDFLTEDETSRLIKLGGDRGYERSSNTGKLKADGKHESKIDNTRTSENTWCQDACYEDPIVKNVLKKIEGVTGIPEVNSEYLQLLRYEKGQFYRLHHDFIGFHKERQCGVRIITFFLYLSDIEEGGGTRFAYLNESDGGLVVNPKRGRALIWPNVLSEDPSKSDKRTYHEAMPVIEGVKYAANAWVHMNDFKTSMERGCI